MAKSMLDIGLGDEDEDLYESQEDDLLDDELPPDEGEPGPESAVEDDLRDAGFDGTQARALVDAILALAGR